MKDKLKKTEFVADTIALNKILEGLIHNINTPLNIIIGYSQHLKKQHPELEALDKIKEAGLQIDDFIQSCQRVAIQKCFSNNTTLELNQWLQDEIKYIKNNLDIKHTLKFETLTNVKNIMVETNPLILSIFWESMFQSTACKKMNQTGSNSVRTEIISEGDQVFLEIQSDSFLIYDEFEEFLLLLYSYLTKEYGIDGINPFSYTMDTSNKIKLIFKRSK